MISHYPHHLQERTVIKNIVTACFFEYLDTTFAKVKTLEFSDRRLSYIYVDKTYHVYLPSKK